MKTRSKLFNIDLNKDIPVDEFVEKALYERDIGYYSNKIPFGSKGDFITAPTISNLFSEIIGIWIVSTWERLGKPKKLNLVELGPGDGSLAKVLIYTFEKFPKFNKAIKIFLYEKSQLLKDVQRKKINNSRVKWIKNFNFINKGPVIFFGNEFFDAIPIKQFFKKNEGWVERFVELKNSKKAEFKEQKINITKLEHSLNFEISKNQKIIEYSPETFKYLKSICEIIQRNGGGMLIIDYGYLGSKMQETLQAVNNHKYSDVLENIGDSDITYNISFNLFQKFTSQFYNLDSIVTNQKKFLTSMGILQRAEIISKNIPFSKKTDLFYRIRRLIDEKQMGELFKVMLIKNIKNQFKTGF